MLGSLRTLVSILLLSCLCQIRDMCVCVITESTLRRCMYGMIHVPKVHVGRCTYLPTVPYTYSCMPLQAWRMQQLTPSDSRDTRALVRLPRQLLLVH